MLFRDQVVMVTGASGALGSTVARAFLGAQARLVLLDRDASRLTAALPELAGAPERWLGASCDLSDGASVQAAVEQAVERFGRIDVLANIAGAYHGGTPVHETDLEVWDRMMNANAKSVFVVSRAVAPLMIAQGSGRILTVASRNAFGAAAGGAVYAAAKSAVVRLTEALSAELKEHGVNVNCIVPGTLDTPANRASMPNADASRWVRTEDLTAVILFLCSGASRAIHGAVLPVYGLT